MNIIYKSIIICLIICISSQYRILGEKKDEYCKDIFIEEEKEDPNGEKYKSQELVTQSQRQSAESIRSKLEIARSKEEAKADIKKMLNDNDYMNYVNSLMFVAIPFIVLLALGSIGAVTYMLGFFLEAHCCKRDIKKKPYSDSDLGRPAICVFFFGLVAIGMIVYGYLIAADFANMSDILKCSVISILDEVVYGAEVGSYEWIGIGNVNGPIKKIIQELDVVGEKQEKHYSDTAWIQKELEDLYNANDGIYDYYQDKEIKSPNPEAGVSDTVPSNYIQNDLGDKNADGTTVFNIKVGIDISSAVWAAAAQGTVDSSANIKINLDTMKDTLNEGRKSIQSTSDQFQELIQTAEEKMEKQQQTNDLLNTFLQVFFGAQLIGATLGFLGVSFTHCSGPRPKCRVLLHLGWLIMSIMMIVGLVLSVILVPTGVMLTETCQWMSDFLKDEVEFNDPSYTFLPPDIMAKISECKFGEGDLSGQFGIKEQFEDINAMLESISITQQLKDEENGTDLSQSITNIDVEIARIQALKEGTESDGDSGVLNDDNPDVSLGNLVKWADHSVAGSYQSEATLGNCQKSQDLYVFDDSLCTTDYSTQYDSTNADTMQNMPDKTCIIINDITLLEQATRYSQISTGTGGCNSQVEQNINNYFVALYQYDMARRSFFLSIENDLNSLKTQTNDYNTKLEDFVTTTDQFSEDISELTAAINDPKDGLLSRFNCKFLGNSMDRVFDAMCVAFISPVFKGILSTAVASVSMFFSSFFAFVLAIRYARKTRASQVAKSKVQNQPKKA